jgi:hypothetical protein
MNGMADGCDYIKDSRHWGTMERHFSTNNTDRNAMKNDRITWFVLMLIMLVLAGCVGSRPAGETPTATRTPDPLSLDCLPENEWVLAEVVRVVDGDTIIAKIDGVDYRVRYIGVDTPETVHPSRCQWKNSARKPRR